MALPHVIVALCNRVVQENKELKTAITTIKEVDEEEIVRLYQSIRTLDEQLQEQREVVLKVQEEVQRLRGQLDEAQRQRELVSQEHQQALDALAAKTAADAREMVGSHQEEMSRLQSSHADMAQNLRTKNSNMLNELLKVKEEVAGLRDLNQDMEVRLTEQAAQIKEKEAQRASLMVERNIQKEENALLAQEIVDLKESLRVAMGQLEVLRETLRHSQDTAALPGRNVANTAPTMRVSCEAAAGDDGSYTDNLVLSLRKAQIKGPGSGLEGIHPEVVRSGGAMAGSDGDDPEGREAAAGGPLPASLSAMGSVDVQEGGGEQDEGAGSEHDMEMEEHDMGMEEAAEPVPSSGMSAAAGETPTSGNQMQCEAQTRGLEEQSPPDPTHSPVTRKRKSDDLPADAIDVDIDELYEDDEEELELGEEGRGGEGVLRAEGTVVPDGVRAAAAAVVANLVNAEGVAGHTGRGDPEADEMARKRQRLGDIEDPGAVSEGERGPEGLNEGQRFSGGTGVVPSLSDGHQVSGGRGGSSDIVGDSLVDDVEEDGGSGCVVGSLEDPWRASSGPQQAVSGGPGDEGPLEARVPPGGATSEDDGGGAPALVGHEEDSAGGQRDNVQVAEKINTSPCAPPTGQPETFMETGESVEPPGAPGVGLQTPKAVPETGSGTTKGLPDGPTLEPASWVEDGGNEIIIDDDVEAARPVDVQEQPQTGGHLKDVIRHELAGAPAQPSAPKETSMQEPQVRGSSAPQMRQEPVHQEAPAALSKASSFPDNPLISPPAEPPPAKGPVTPALETAPTPPAPPKGQKELVNKTPSISLAPVQPQAGQPPSSAATSPSVPAASATPMPSKQPDVAAPKPAGLSKPPEPHKELPVLPARRQQQQKPPATQVAAPIEAVKTGKAAPSSRPPSPQLPPGFGRTPSAPTGSSALKVTPPSQQKRGASPAPQWGPSPPQTRQGSLNPSTPRSAQQPSASQPQIPQRAASPQTPRTSQQRSFTAPGTTSNLMNRSHLGPPAAKTTPPPHHRASTPVSQTNSGPFASPADPASKLRAPSSQPLPHEVRLQPQKLTSHLVPPGAPSGPLMNPRTAPSAPPQAWQSEQWRAPRPEGFPSGPHAIDKGDRRDPGPLPGFPENRPASQHPAIHPPRPPGGPLLPAGAMNRPAGLRAPPPPPQGPLLPILPQMPPDVAAAVPPGGPPLMHPLTPMWMRPMGPVGPVMAPAPMNGPLVPQFSPAFGPPQLLNLHIANREVQEHLEQRLGSHRIRHQHPHPWNFCGICRSHQMGHSLTYIIHTMATQHMQAVELCSVQLLHVDLSGSPKELGPADPRRDLSLEVLTATSPGPRQYPNADAPCCTLCGPHPQGLRWTPDLYVAHLASPDHANQLYQLLRRAYQQEEARGPGVPPGGGPFLDHNLWQMCLRYLEGCVDLALILSVLVDICDEMRILREQPWTHMYQTHRDSLFQEYEVLNMLYSMMCRELFSNPDGFRAFHPHDLPFPKHPRVRLPVAALTLRSHERCQKLRTGMKVFGVPTIYNIVGAPAGVQ